MEEFDFAIIGSGPGGYSAAFRAARGGAKTCLIEGALLGGVCLNAGCIPTKALLRSASLFSQMERAQEWGIEVGPVSLNFKRSQQRKDRIVSALARSLKELLDKKDVELIKGMATLKGPGELILSLPGGEKKPLRAKNIIVATGTKPLIPKTFPFDGEKVFTSDEALQLSSLPQNLLVIGGGYIACEFAYLFCQCGVEVTLLVRSRILRRMDESLGNALTKAFKKMGMRIIIGKKVESLTINQSTVVTQIDGELLENEKVMICLGRTPNTRNIGLEELGVHLDSNGLVKIDEYCQTAVAGVYAIGDITSEKQLANLAFRQGVVAVEHALGLDTSMDYSSVPGCVFTQPEIATVGLSEEEARRSGRELKVGTFPMRWLGKAWVYGETEGFLKLVADGSTGEILGVHILGPYAGELVGEAALALKTKSTLKDITTSMPIHPAYSEALTEAAKELLGIGMYG
ncbi:MAG: dihydrolipoyl dehydrogenase [Planctomycetes bacterium RIFCSPHIGHO2_02_FULL_52_58]|nr:MAG: dihydrolipoyl dehydrogenase [Planctomycetes bacterium RIFCSPHIGHO2_02_FULL_52_58]